MNVSDLMRRAAQFHHNKPAIIAGSVRLTFGEAWERGLRMANALIAAGLKPGDRCGSLEDNHHMAVDFFLGAAIANVVRVPLYARNARASHAYMLDHTDCKVVVVDAAHAQFLQGLDQELDSLEQIIVRGDDYEQWLASFPATDPQIEAKPDDLYVVRHTGGTEGKSKGVPYTHRAWLETGRNWFYPMPPVAPGDVCMHIAPISHASGYQFIPMWLSGGVNMVMATYNAEETVRAMREEPVNYLFMVPTMVSDIMAVPGVADYDWPDLKVLLVGASPITETNLRRAYAIFGGALCSLYGQSEGVPVTLCMAEDWLENEAPGSNPYRSVGRLHPFCEVKIVDTESDQTLGYGEEGEICFRTDGQLPGYWQNPEASANAIKDGWVHTGDVGYLDQNGYLYLCDRKDDMILSGGFNIWPAELENVIATLDGVQEVVVVGIPDERFGEVPHAFIMEKSPGAVTAEAVIELCAKQLGSYKKPGSVAISAEPIARTPVGKISRKMLRKPFWEGLGRTK